MIDFPDKQGANYLTVNESAKTNIITARALGNRNGSLSDDLVQCGYS